MFCVHTTRKKAENATITGHFGLVDCRDAIVFEKGQFSKCFPSTLKQKDRVLKFLRFEEHFEKLRFRDGLV